MGCNESKQNKARNTVQSEGKEAEVDFTLATVSASKRRKEAMRALVPDGEAIGRKYGAGGRRQGLRVGGAGRERI